MNESSSAIAEFRESNTWSTLVDMPTPRGSYGATYIDGRIVAVGGEDPTQVLGAAEMYDIADGKWIKLAPLPTPRHAEVVAAVANTVYVIGGADRPTHEALSQARSWVAKWTTAAGAPNYLSAFGRVIANPERGHLEWTAAEAEAWRKPRPCMPKGQ